MKLHKEVQLFKQVYNHASVGDYVEEVRHNLQCYTGLHCALVHIASATLAVAMCTFGCLVVQEGWPQGAIVSCLLSAVIHNAM